MHIDEHYITDRPLKICTSDCISHFGLENTLKCIKFPVKIMWQVVLRRTQVEVAEWTSMVSDQKCYVI